MTARQSTAHRPPEIEAGPAGGGVVISDDGRRLRPVKSLVKALRLLDLLAGRPDGLGLTELATAGRTSKTAAYNLVSTLEIEGLVRRDDRQRYHLGWRLLELGEAVRASWSLGAAARAHVVQLADSAGETAVLAILDGPTVFCVEMVESRRSTPIDHGPGRRTDPRSDATGLVLLAHGRRSDMPALAAAPRNELAERLSDVRANGYAVVRGEADAGLTTIAAPVNDYRQQTVAALALVGPSRRLSNERCAELVPTVVGAATQISAALGA